MLKFSKMHGLGNDFVVIDAINQQVNLNVQDIRFLADRRFGIGCDQLLVVEKPTKPDVDFRYRIFNADGSEVAQCGNGVRCFARFVRDKQLTDKDAISVETVSGIVYPTLQENDNVTVDMGSPQFDPQGIPFVCEEQAHQYSLDVNSDAPVSIGAVSMGNPHAVMLVENITSTDVASIGPMIESHKLFPEGVNAGFMQIVDRSHVNLRVYERGAGETLACGTGACAAAVIGIQQGLLNSEVKVSLPGGDLNIVWAGDNESVWMTGPATHVFDGEIAWAIINNH
ncbi:diaminopimelate epimerase [Pseudomonadota bacterium]|nr:diaminopimelate epimerase [Pseudomonadota bacterium]